MDRFRVVSAGTVRRTRPRARNLSTDPRWITRLAPSPVEGHSHRCPQARLLRRTHRRQALAGIGHSAGCRGNVRRRFRGSEL